MLSGKPLVLDNLSIKNPTLQNIIDLGEDNFQKLIHLFVFQLSDYAIEFDKAGQDYTKQDKYLTFISLCMCDNKETPNILDPQIHFLLGWLSDIKDWQIGFSNSKNIPVLYSEETEAIIDKENFFKIRKFFYTILFRQDKEDFIAGNEYARKRYIEMKKEEREDMLKHKIDTSGGLYNTISCLVWGNTSGVNYDNVWNLTLFQVNDGLERISRIKQYDVLSNAYYSGNISSKKSNFLDEIDWRNEFKFTKSRGETIGEINKRIGNSTI